MPPPTPSDNRHSTMSKATLESSSPRTLPKKRKTTSSATSASSQLLNTKRIKTEIMDSTEPRVSNLTESREDSIYDTIVSVRVGEMAANFGIHRGLLRRESKFFRGKLASIEATESELVTQVVVMRDENPDTFRRFKNWLYSGRIISESESYESLAWSELIAVYTFAERKGCPLLQNRCVDTVIRKKNQGGLFPGQADVNTLWNASGQVFRLQQLLVDMFAAKCNLINALATNRSYHSGFLRRLILALYDMKEEPTKEDEADFWKKRRKYYVYDTENPIQVD